MTTRGTSNTNDRGSASDRRARRAWVLRTFDTDLGPTEARCYECSEIVDWDTMEIDRIVSGMNGGRYVRGNIRPSCAACNCARGIEEREAAHAATCHGRCRRCRLVLEYRVAREAAELERESVTAGYATENRAYGPLITFREWLVANAYEGAEA